LLRFYTETEIFNVSIEPKQTEGQPKQFDMEHILVFFRKFRVARVFSVCFGLFRNNFFSFVSLLTESFDVSLEPKLTEGQPKPFDREHIFF